MNQYKLIIKVCGNVDHNENPFVAPLGMCEEYIKTANEIYDLQLYFKDFVDEYNLGASNIKSANVYKNNHYVGYICYNGNWKSTSSEN